MKRLIVLFSAALLCAQCTFVRTPCSSVDPTCSDGAAVSFVYALTNRNTLPVAGAILWLNANDATVLDQKAVAWPDSSGTGNNMVDVGSVEYVSGGLNGNSFIRLGTGSDYLEVRSPSAMPLGDAPVTMHAVFRRRESNVADFPTVFEIGNHTLTDQALVMYIDTTANFRFGANNGDSAQSSATNVIDTWYILTGTYSGNVGTYHVYVDGNVSGMGTEAGGISLISDAMMVGITDDLAQHLVQDIAEIIVYPSLLSDTDRSLVECYLSRKYGISATGC